MPKGKIGELEISRILLGGNLLTHYTHSRELRYVYNLAAHYNTEKKIIETWRLPSRTASTRCPSTRQPPGSSAC